jgi:chemotaxis protein histidine kinase CheA
MQNIDQENAFNFSPRFNAAFLYELYGGDVKTAVHIFTETYNQVNKELGLAAEYFKQDDTAALKKVYHKIKPLFGYVGLDDVQDMVQQFEDACLKALHATDIQYQYNTINETITGALENIKTETERLEAHINKRA